ncbi:MAG: hypothetical protein KDD47_23770 [Acidobacteria bacterium]|nr:hypothetical protein [Acidobacteriota bacterium]
MLRDEDYLRSSRGLSLAHRNLQGLDLSPLGLYENLVSLDLSFTGITDPEVPALPPMAGLRWLELEANPLSNDALKVVQRLPALEELDLRQTLVTEEGLAHLERHASLRHALLPDGPLEFPDPGAGR